MLHTKKTWYAGGTHSPPGSCWKCATWREEKATLTWEEGRGRERKGKGEVGLASRKKLLKTPTFQFITKLLYTWKAFHRNG